MVPEKSSPFFFRFGAFEVDLRAGELRKQGVRIRIQEQPFRLLVLLLRRPGELLTRDELRAQIWPADTFVDFDKGLNTSVNRLREALGDAADNPRFVETVPRRGYRFIAPVTTNHVNSVRATTADENVKDKPSAASRNVIVTAAVILALGIVAASRLPWPWLHSHPLADTDTIVLGDFTNTTGDPVFDGSLRQGLTVELEQSPYLYLLSQDQVQTALRLMKQPADVRLTPDVAWEVCQRTNSTAVLDGSISQVGTRYDLVLRAFRCSDRSFLASTEVQASDKNHVLESLSTASSTVRRKLGESLRSVQKYNAPLEQATTTSLDALRLYSLGYAAIADKGDSSAAIPFFQRAAELDPNFAMAYVLLGTSYWNLGESALASENIRRAFDLRNGTSEYERLRIETEYHCLVTDDLLKGKRALEVWVQTYPRDWAPHNRLGVVYLALGEHDAALKALQEAHRLYPHSSLIWGNLIYSYIALNRLDEATAAAEEAKRENPDSPGLRVGLYRLAFLENNRDQMKEQVAFSTGKPGLEDELLWNEAATDSYFGRIEASASHYREAALSAERSGEKEAAAAYEADAAFTHAIFGFQNEARRRADSVIHHLKGPDIQFKAALALALSGETNRADALAKDLDHAAPHDTVVQFVYLPVLRAQAALSRRNAAQAIEALRSAAPFDMSVSLMPVYFRGLAYLARDNPAQAATEFEKIINHRGIVLNSPIGSLAYLQLARAISMQGDSERAKHSYQRFFEIWRDADHNIPVLKLSKLEYAKLH
jgi:DNA-binding winged helix-turn-helix (wHTH) protein/tetratricopeptide (TPR) repeat protein